MKRHDMIYTICLLFLLCGLSSCSEDFPAGNKPELNGLVMQLQIDGNPASVLSSRVAADPTLRENLVAHVDVFFSSDGTNIDEYRHAALGADNRLVLAGADWKDEFPATSYTVYVLANKHDYEDTDNYLSGITTVEQLESLTDTDTEVNKAEGETSSGGETYSGKLFFMDGQVTWTPPTDAVDETIEVELHRAAAKFVVNIGFQSTDDFNLDDISIIGVRKKVVNYMPEAMALAEVTPDYETMDAVTGDASGSGLSNTNYTNGKTGEERKDILYAYAYPNAWGDDAERETYLLINVPFADDEGNHNNYYKVPIRISSDASQLHIDRNTQYTVNVTVDRKGNEEIDIPVPLKPTFNVAGWETTTINVDDNTPSYLVLSHEHIEMHNVTDTIITFFSSAQLQNVQIIDAYFINKEGERQDEQATRWHTNYQGEIIVDASRDVSSYCEIENWTENALQGNIKFSGEIPTNVTARYVTLRVTSSDPDLNPNYKDVTIVQYPLEYISGAPGWYSARSDFDATWEDNEKGTQFWSKPTVSNNIFSSKYYNNGIIYTYVAKGSEEWWEQEQPPFTIVSGSNQSPQNNNRMYLVQMTSTNSNYIIARPKTTIDEDDGQMIAVDNDSQNNELVSPAFMLASQLGTVTADLSWNNAQNQCKNYIEVIRYSDGTKRELTDWRLPTEAELSVIAGYQDEQPEVMDQVLRGWRYWTALQNTYYSVPGDDKQRSTGARCVRDVSPEDLAEFRAHNIR